MRHVGSRREPTPRTNPVTCAERDVHDVEETIAWVRARRDVPVSEPLGVERRPKAAVPPAPAGDHVRDEDATRVVDHDLADVDR